MPLLLSQASSLNPGAELWILPQEDQSNWYARLDWYLNFTLARIELKPEMKISAFLEAVNQECNLELLNVNPKEPLLISVNQWLPARWVLILPYKEDLQNWTDAIVNQVGSLKTGSLRVFLPRGKRFDEAQPYFEASGLPSDLTVVLD